MAQIKSEREREKSDKDLFLRVNDARCDTIKNRSNVVDDDDDGDNNIFFVVLP